ncbi:RNA 3'-terminal phosphate cyclase [Spraguea lophii 42_110]|uniref:RNA 3'-terminal phosphate cyclase n=1 Tax=Spraguea lophii (strain 42_110) TaxID=1358809 RepID=S7W5I2_SPRLO|nr:RNA 3'-terminal phosphate cyclase [Spraguea lophii 42_110]
MIEFEEEKIGIFVFVFSMITRNPIKFKDTSFKDFMSLLKKISPETEIKEFDNYIEFIPGSIIGGNFSHEPQNIISDYVLPLLIILSFARKDTVIKFFGITNGIGNNVLSIDVIKNVYLKLIQDFGMNADLKIIKRGFYPEGKGEIELKVYNIGQIKFVEKDEKTIFKIRGLAISNRLNSLTTTKMVEIVQTNLKQICKNLKISKDICGGSDAGPSPGYQIVLFAEGNNMIYYSEEINRENKKLEEITMNTIHKLLQSIDVGGAYDYKATNFILTLMSLSEKECNKIKIKIGKENKKYIELIKQFLTFQIEKEEGFVLCYGNGIKNINRLNL